EAEEIQRLFYVAATRAADRLILSAGLTPDMALKSPWLKSLAERFDLLTGSPKYDPYFCSIMGGEANRETIPEILVHREPPEAAVTKPTTERPIPLAQLPELLEQAAATEFPETAKVYVSTRDWLGSISVSHLEEEMSEHPPNRD